MKKTHSEFDFLNSRLWLKYTQDKYIPIEGIQYRLDSLNIHKNEWPKFQRKILKYRKMNSVPLFVKTLNKKFWYFPADCISRKIHKIEKLGDHIFGMIENQKTFRQEFLHNAVVEEAVTSAIYEGANSTRNEAKTLIAEGRQPKNKAEWMLLNNYNAMMWIKKNFNKPFSINLILEIHKTVVLNTLEGVEASFAGQFRNDTVFIGEHEGVSHKKIKPSLEEVIQLISDHPRFLHSLVKGILFHYFIAHIHPFFDGNGRTARTLFYLTAMKHDLKFVEILSISADLKKHGNRYDKAFDWVKKYQWDLTYFVDFCLDSLLTAIEQVKKKADFLIDIASLKDHFNLSYCQIAILQKTALNKHRSINIEGYAKNINRSREFVRKELKDLLKKSFLREEKIGKKNVYYIKSKHLKSLVEKARLNRTS